MGMYDTLNDWQVKCFHWVSFYKGGISYHGGDLKYYCNGSEIPYKKPHYNYGKNFVILDLNRCPDSEYWDYDYILHVIIDGKLKDTFENKIGEIDWGIIQNVVDYYGTFLNIHNSNDLLNYMKEQRECWEKYDVINSRSNELFREWTKYLKGFGLLDKEKDKDEIEHRKRKINEIQRLIDEEKKRTESEKEKLSNSIDKWFVDTSDISDLIHLGDFISSYDVRDDEKDECKEMITSLLENDSTLYDRYVKWQGSDEFIRKFKL